MENSVQKLRSRFVLFCFFLFVYILTMAWRRKWKPAPVFFLGKSHGLGSLVGYSPWALKESDMTEPLNISQWPELRYICRRSMNTHTHTHTHTHVYVCACLAAQLCLTLCDPLDYSPLGSSVHGILQARILEWVAMSSSRGSS